MESILIDFIICGIVTTVLSAVSALIKNYYTPVAVNSNYIEDIASGGTGIAVVSVGNTLADIIDYIDIITKTINRVKKFIEDKNNSNEKDN